MLFAFYCGRARFFNRFVSWWTRGPYSHAEAILPGFADLRKPVLCGSSSFMDGGVRLKVIDLNPAHWHILDVPGVDALHVLDGLHRLKGAPYDLPGLLSTSFPLVPHSARGYFCNEVLGELIGLRDPWRLTPTGFARVLELLPGSRWLTWKEIGK
ncbi:MAG TPA: hypothetical protein VNT52_01010 [Acidimicrobiales bacterium]|nr:hypothetical protein [Acidimicrobiales bacterium]